VYSARLAESLAATGVELRYLGFGSDDAIPATAADVQWVAVPDGKRSEIVALFSRLPNAAAIDATRTYRSMLEAQLQEPWDAIVLDAYGTGWALDRCLAYCYAQQPQPVLVHISHNHEGALWRSMASEARASLPRRVVLWQNALKVRTLEQRIVRNVDLLSAITDEDREALTATLPRPASVLHTLTLTPGYAGSTAPPRIIDADTPRRVAIVGSFRWVMKQENLRRFVESADAVFARHGIELDVIGDVPEPLQAELAANTYATHFHGFVDDPAAALTQTRMAVVPELIGGGFKLKFLDYLFARTPVATLTQAAAGLPPQLRAQMLSCADLPSLIDGIVADIDRFDELNRRQQRAFELAQALYRWEDRGLQLRHAIVSIQRERQSGAREPIATLKGLSAAR